SAYEKSGKVNSDYKYRERNIGNGSDDYDRELLKKVNEKIKKRENKFKVASFVAIAVAVVLILVMFLPIVPVRHDSMDIRVLVNNMSNYSLDEFPEAGKFEDLKDDNTIFVYDDDCVKNKAFDELTFYEVNAPILPQDTTFMVAEGFDLSKLVVVEVSSNKIIKSYSYKEKNSRLVFSHFRTSLAGLILSNDENSFTTRVVNFDGVKEVVFE
ncbi:MAG: hypothetical protein K5776_04145, partial [Lachnospiraceae bacterium]|nr:hypothetical protein [Lachnospiraceae bacterium]